MDKAVLFPVGVIVMEIVDGQISGSDVSSRALNLWEITVVVTTSEERNAQRPKM